MRYEIFSRVLLFFLAFDIFGVWFYANSTPGNGACTPPLLPIGIGGYIPRKQSYMVNESVIYGCPPSVSLHGSNRRTCLPDGSWSGSTPSCGCVRPALPFGGGTFEPQKNIYNVSDSVSYRCHNRLSIFGNIVLTCLSDGSWSGYAPYCGCLKPVTLYGIGSYKPPKQIYGVNESVTYECPSKYYLFGSRFRRCLQNATWSGSVPHCAQKLRPVRLGHHSISKLFDDVGTTCEHYGPNDKPIYFQIKGTFKTVVIQILSNTNSAGMRVYYRDNSPLRHDHSFILNKQRYESVIGLYSTWFIYKSPALLADPAVLFACDYGCSLCEVNIFTDVAAVCSQKPPPIENGGWLRWQFGYEYPFNYTLGGVCKDGYRFSSKSPIATCNSEGAWTVKPSDVRCQTVVCSQKLPPIENGGWLGWQFGEEYPFNYTLDGVCKDGYRFSSESPIATCNSEGAWTVKPSDIRCQKIECSENPPELKNANWSDWENGKIYPFNSTLEAVCNYGYKSHGKPIIVTCNGNETWTPESIEDLCQEQLAFSSRNTVSVAVAAIGLILVLLFLGFCIFWTRRNIKRCKKRAYQADVLLENPIYNSSPSSLYSEECIANPDYHRPQTDSKDLNMQYSCVSNEEITDQEMVTNEIYFTECPIAKPIHAHNPSIYAEDHKDDQSKSTLISLPKGEREMQEIVVENEIYGT